MARSKPGCSCPPSSDPSSPIYRDLFFLSVSWGSFFFDPWAKWTLSSTVEMLFPPSFSSLLLLIPNRAILINLFLYENSLPTGAPRRVFFLMSLHAQSQSVIRLRRQTALLSPSNIYRTQRRTPPGDLPLIKSPSSFSPLETFLVLGGGSLSLRVTGRIARSPFEFREGTLILRP